MIYKNALRFEILRTRNCPLEQRKCLAGFSFLNPDEDFYTLKYLFLPGISFYLVRQRDKEGYYSIYSKCFNADGGGQKFAYSVGYGRRIMTENGPIIELNMFDLRGPYLMHLNPVVPLRNENTNKIAA